MCTAQLQHQKYQCGLRRKTSAPIRNCRTCREACEEMTGISPPVLRLLGCFRSLGVVCMPDFRERSACAQWTYNCSHSERQARLVHCRPRTVPRGKGTCGEIPASVREKTKILLQDRDLFEGEKGGKRDDGETQSLLIERFSSICALQVSYCLLLNG